MMNKIALVVFLACSFSIRAQNQADNNNQGKPRDNMMWFNLSALDWVRSFDSLHFIMSERYPYTEWKGINWDQKYLYSQPKIQEAKDETDTVKYTAAMFEYLYSIPDGHVMYRGLFGNFNAFRQATQAGSFGLNLIPVSDGSIVANIVTGNGPAYLAGLRCGDQVTSWNGIPIAEVPEMEVYKSTNSATLEGRLINRYQILARGAIGETINVTFISHETGIQQTATLTAEADNFSLLQQAHFLTIPMPDMDSVVVYKTLDDQIGYLRVLDEDAPDSLTLEEIRQNEIYLAVKEAITYFNEQNIDKLIFDLRYNGGGNDLLGSAISGFFVQEPMFYEYITGTSDDNYAIVDSIITVQETPNFDGEVVVMVSPNNISTGEGIPMMLQRLNRAQVVSFWGTNGSFGIVPNVVIMPDSLHIIIFPYARSLDENQVIQLDSDAELAGGVQPDIQIPLTVERVIQVWQEGIDVELEYAKSILLDIQEYEGAKGLKIYPNPARDWMCIDSDLSLKVNLMIYNGCGNLVKGIENHRTGDRIHIGDLPGGVYFVKIANKEMYLTGKLVIGQ